MVKFNGLFFPFYFDFLFFEAFQLDGNFTWECHRTSNITLVKISINNDVFSLFIILLSLGFMFLKY